MASIDVAYSVFIVALAALHVSGSTSGKKPMNFIIFNPDEMRAESLGCYGHPVSKTPNFDAFAKQGTLFEQCHTTYTVCSQSRASFMTGWYTHVRGHRTLWHLLHDDEPNLLRYLKNAGYTVNWWGKNDLLAADSFNSSVTLAMQSGGGMNGDNKYDFGVPGYYSFLSKAFDGNMTEMSDYRNVEAAIEFLQTKPDEPFMLYLPLTKPHPPYSAPEPFYSQINPKDLPDFRPPNLKGKPDYHQLIRKYRNLTSLDETFFKQLQAVYLGSISFSDHLFGMLLQALEETGYADSTAVFVFADHGDYAGDYGLVEKWPSGLEDVLTRVPLLARVPGGAKSHKVTEQVQHMDVVATILSLANITAQHTHFSQDLTPILMGAAGDPERVVYAEGGYGTNEPRDFEGICTGQEGMCNPKQIYYPKGLQQQRDPLSVCRSVMIRTPKYKLVYRSDERDSDHCSELYDLQKDPRELNNVYNDSSYASIRQQLQEQLLLWYIQTSDVTPFNQDGRGYFPHYNDTKSKITIEMHRAGLNPDVVLGEQPILYHPKEANDLEFLKNYYTSTPMGYRLKHCVHEVPSGTRVEENEHGGLRLSYPNSVEVIDLPKCSQTVGGLQLPVTLPQKSKSGLPEDYDGWLAYTAFHATSSEGFSAYLGNFSVPNVPEKAAKVLYLFTGLQNKNWIPKVDPQSEAKGFDIIQPVLQYPCGTAREWCVKSWYVALDDRVVVSEPTPARPGDSVFGNMTKIGPYEWYVGSTVDKTTFIRVKRERLSQQFWAYNTLEGYGVKGCPYYPTNDCLFSSLSLSSGGQIQSEVDWQINPKPDPDLKCHESVKVLSSTSVKMDFGN